MGRRQTETSYQTEAAYLKSVLLWLQGKWTKPDPPRFYPPKEVAQGPSPEDSRGIKSATRHDNRSARVLATIPPAKDCQSGTAK
jgi:hypothetical protein